MMIGILVPQIRNARIFCSLATGSYRLSTLALLFTNNLEECDRNQAAGGRNERVARLVPLSIVFATQHMEEIALVKSQLLTILILRFVVVEGFDNFLRRYDSNGALCAEAEMRRLALIFVAFERPTNSLKNEKAPVSNRGVQAG
jgi:hypothetical protein